MLFDDQRLDSPNLYREPPTKPDMGPLAGVKVLDLSRLAPGPYCAMLLGDLGAEVLRIDAPRPPARTYAMLARNKRALTLDLKCLAGREVLHKLCANADVVVEGNRPGVTQRLGADYSTLSAINPRIVYCSLTGYGQEGELAQAAGHDINYIAVSGVLSQIGLGGRPVPPLNLVADFGGGGLLAAYGIVAALFERERSGKGQWIDAAMIDGAASMMSSHYSTGGELSRPGTGLLGGGAPFYRCYRTQDDRYVAVGAVEPKFFAALCEGTGVDFQDRQMERDEWQQQAAELERRFAKKSRDQWNEIFTRLDACVTPVLDLDEAPQHSHNLARNAFQRAADGSFQVAPAPRFSRTPASIRSPAPESGVPVPGSDAAAVLTEAGYNDSDIGHLLSTGAFGQAAKTRGEDP